MAKEQKGKTDIVEQIDKGMELSREKLIKAKAAVGGYLVYEKDGIIVKVKAEDL